MADSDQFQNNYSDQDNSSICKKPCCKNIKLIICSIIIIMISITDLVFHIASELNSFILIDDVVYLLSLL